MFLSQSEGLVVRLCGLKSENDDEIRAIFNESVISILRDSEEPTSIFMRYFTNNQGARCRARKILNRFYNIPNSKIDYNMCNNYYILI